MSSATSVVPRLIEIGRLDEARRIVEEHLGRTPDDPWLLAQAARLEVLAGNLDDAEAHAERAVALAPADVGVRWSLFAVLVARMRYHEADRLLEGLAREHPDDPDILAWRARIALVRGDVDLAGLRANEALRTCPDDPQVIAADVLVSLEEGRPRHALERARELFRREPGHREFWAILFRALVANERYREAHELGRERLRANPDDPELVENLIALRVAAGWTRHPLRVLLHNPLLLVLIVVILTLTLAASLAVSHVIAVPIGIALLLGVVAGYRWIHTALWREWYRRRGFR